MSEFYAGGSSSLLYDTLLYWKEVHDHLVLLSEIIALHNYRAGSDMNVTTLRPHTHH